MGIKLSCIDGPLKGKSKELPVGVYTVGRSEHCDLQIVDDDKVSREHVRINVTNGVAQIEDLNSKNGTFVNGRRVVTERVTEGDEMMLGSCLFRVKVVSEHPTPQPGPVVVDAYIPPPMAEAPKTRYAGFWIRLAARFIDTLVVGLPLTLLAFLGLATIESVRQNPAWWSVLYGLFCFVVVMAYFTLLDSDGQATFGRRATGTCVRSASMGPASRSQAMTRYLLHFTYAGIAPALVSAAAAAVTFFLVSKPSATPLATRLLESMPWTISVASAAAMTYFLFYYILLAGDAKKRGWHDGGAGTVVTYRD